MAGTVIYTIKKFGSTDSYDFYQTEKREKEYKSKASKYAWKSKQDKEKAVADL